MEGSLWKEALGRNLESYDTVEPVDEACHANSCRKKTTRLHDILCIILE